VSQGRKKRVKRKYHHTDILESLKLMVQKSKQKI